MSIALSSVWHKNLKWLFLKISIGGLSEFWKFALQLYSYVNTVWDKAGHYCDFTGCMLTRPARPGPVISRPGPMAFRNYRALMPILYCCLCWFQFWLTLSESINAVVGCRCNSACTRPGIISRPPATFCPNSGNYCKNLLILSVLCSSSSSS